jgi:hypothetical protein
MASVSEAAVMLRDAFVRVFGYTAWVAADAAEQPSEARA